MVSKPIKYYQNLITSEYRLSPKFMAWLTVLLQKMDDASTVADKIDLAFDLDNAVGVQLDALGVILGRERTVTFQPTDGSSPTLNDENYRLALKAKVLLNQWKGKIGELQPVWQVLFPGGGLIVKDNQDMTMTVAITGNLTMVQRDLVANGYIIPKPQAVGVNYFFGDLPVFGYDISNQFFDGYDVGKWVLIPGYIVFAYDMDDLQFQGYDNGIWSN